MIETMAHRYSSESAQGELSNEYQRNRVKMFFKKSLRPCAFDESSLSIGRVKWYGGRHVLICVHISEVSFEIK